MTKGASQLRGGYSAGKAGFSFWRFNLICWLMIGIFGFAVRWFLHGDPWVAITFTLLQEPVGFLLSSFLFLIYRKFSLDSPFRLQSAAALIVLSFGATLVQSFIAYLVTVFTGWNAPGWTIQEAWFFRTTFIWLLYMVWSLAYFALSSRVSERAAQERERKATEEKQKMELQLLRSQLDPHFLFNSLNGIAAEIEPRPQVAVRVVEELAAYLRFSLDHRSTMLTTIAGELEAVGAYLEVEKARHGERVQTEIHIDPAVRNRSIPAFLLQPLIENAIKHGLDKSPSDWRLEIEAHGSSDQLEIHVRNSGSLTKAPENGEGLGLENLHRRLELHYPKRFQFSLAETGGMVHAALQLEGEPCSK